MDENVSVLVLSFPTLTSDVFTQTEVADTPTDEVDPLGADSPGKRKRVEDTTDIAANREIKKAKFETKALKAKRPGFTEERYNETSYYVENALRKVYPYYFTFTTFTKGRWVGEKILDVFSKEFRAHPAEEYARCIKSGTLTVNYEQVELDYRLKHNDLLANIVHRHEVPVTCEPIKVLHLDDELLVVNKPASIPVHPCGRYRHNTVVFILAKEHNLKNLRTVHRLDRLTSGLLLFGRTPNKARIMEGQIRNRQVEKEYVCRVEGKFPEEEIVCTEKIEVVSYKIGVCKVSDNGKECRTVFKKLSYNGVTSVVLAKPHTGRMHQIRVHLQFLGYPIINDPLYNHEVFGPNKGKGGVTGKSDEDLVSDLINLHNAENWLGIGDGETLDAFPPSAPAGLSVGDAEVLLTKDTIDGLSESLGDEEGSTNGGNEAATTSSAAPEASKITIGTQTSEVELGSTGTPLEDSVEVTTETVHESEQRQLRAARAAKPQEFVKDPFCYECKVKYRDPRPRDLVMYLHALSYKGPDWCYKSPLPEWANEDWVES